MGVITRAYSEVDGTVAEASSVNRVIDDLYTLQAGNINSANLASASIGSTNIENSAITSVKINGSAITIEKLDVTTTRDPKDTFNYSLAASVSSSTLTISLKDSLGNNATSTSPITITFRHGTAATGTSVIRTVTAALSTVVSSGSTLGHKSAILSPIHVFLLDDAGTIDLCYSTTRMWDEQYLQNTTAEGGAGAADSATVLYSTSTRSNVSIRYLGTLFSNQGTAGTWASTMTRISLAATNQVLAGYSEIFLSGGLGHGAVDTKIRRFVNSQKNVGSAISTNTTANNGSTFTINEAGIYSISYQDFLSSGISAFGLSVNSTELTTAIGSITLANYLGRIVHVSAQPGMVNVVLFLNAGDVIRPHTDGTQDVLLDILVNFRIVKVAG